MLSYNHIYNEEKKKIEQDILNKPEFSNLTFPELTEYEYKSITTEFDNTTLEKFIKKMILVWQHKKEATKLIKQYMDINLVVKKRETETEFTKSEDVTSYVEKRRNEFNRINLLAVLDVINDVKNSKIIFNLRFFYSINFRNSPVQSFFMYKGHTYRKKYSETPKENFIWKILYDLDLTRRYGYSVNFVESNSWKKDFDMLKKLFYLSEGDIVHGEQKDFIKPKFEKLFEKFEKKNSTDKSLLL